MRTVERCIDANTNTPRTCVYVQEQTYRFTGRVYLHIPRKKTSISCPRDLGTRGTPSMGIDGAKDKQSRGESRGRLKQTLAPTRLATHVQTDRH